MSRASECILDSGILGQQLGGQIGVGDIFVVRREGVARETEGADPEFTADINLAVKVGIDYYYYYFR